MGKCSKDTIKEISVEVLKKVNVIIGFTSQLAIAENHLTREYRLGNCQVDL